MLIIHFLGLAMALGTSFSFMFLGMASSKLGKEEGAKFMFTASAVSRMGHIGLLLLFLSGGYLMTPYWKALGSNPLLIAKLSLFVVLGALLGIMSSKMRKAKANQSADQLASAGKLGPVAMIVGVTIVILAVLNFH